MRFAPSVRDRDHTIRHGRRRCTCAGWQALCDVLGHPALHIGSAIAVVDEDRARPRVFRHHLVLVAEAVEFFIFQLL